MMRGNVISNAVTKEEGWKKSIQKAQEGDKKERDALITANTGLVYMVIRRFANRGHEQEDLFQIGVIGLMKAIDNFDLSRNLSFSTYAVPMIAGEVRRFLRDDGMLHVSRRIKEHARLIAIAKETLYKSSANEPTMKDLMQATGLDMDEIVAAMEATSDVESIYQPIRASEEGNELYLLDQLEDVRQSETEVIDRLTVRQMLESLGEKERRLLELRYLEGKTQSESAHVLKMNQVAVSRLEKAVLKRLRQQL